MITCNSTQLFNKQFQNKQLHDIFSDFKSIDLPDEISISTMTITCKFDTLINIENIGKYIDMEHGKIVYMEYGNDNIRSLMELKKNNKNKKKKHKSFYNQATIKIEVQDKKKNKKVNIKVFKNGSIQITGCRNMDQFTSSMTILCEELNKKKAIYDKTEKKIIKKEFVTEPNNVNINNISGFKIRLIVSNFNVDFLINRAKLFSILRKEDIRCSFEPCIHACVNIKYNYKNKDTVSIFVFESGSIIITGAKTKDHIIEAYKFITKVLYENYHDVVKNNVEQFLERSDIVELIVAEIEAELATYSQLKIAA